MAELQIPPGLTADDPAEGGPPRWFDGVNVRFTPAPETIGLSAKIRDAGGTPIDLYLGATLGHGVARQVETFTPPGTATGAAITIFAGVGLMKAIDQNAGAAPGPGELIHRQLNIMPLVYNQPSEVTPFRPYSGPTISPRWSFAGAPNALFAVQAAEDVANPVFYWVDYDEGTVMIPVPGSPTGAVACAVTDDQHLILFGAESVGGGIDRMTVRWPNRGDPTDWIPTDINTAGEIQLNFGTKIMAGGRTGHGLLCWTDKAFYLIEELRDNAYFFSQKLIDGTSGILGTGAWTEVDGRIFWLGADMTFRVWTGGGAPQEIRCPIRDNTVDGMDASIYGFVQAYSDSAHNEVGWLLPGGGTNYGLQLVYNYSLGTWSVHDRFDGDMTAITGRTGGVPGMAATSDGAAHLTDLQPPRTDLVWPAAAAAVRDVPTNLTAEPRAWSLRSSIFSPMADMPVETFVISRLLVSATVRRKAGAAADSYEVVLTGFEEQGGVTQVTEALWGDATIRSEPRVEARTMRYEIRSDPAQPTGDTTVRRFGTPQISYHKQARGRR